MPSPDPSATEDFEIVRLADLGIDGLDLMLFRYRILELSTAVKPFLLAFLLASRGLGHLFYFDPDILFLHRLDRLVAEFASADILLTPHLLSPVETTGRPDERSILAAGCYNLGFIGVRAGEETQRMLGWWQQRLRRWCLNQVENAMFVDQRWADLIPSYHAGTRILRDPGLNVAYWNIGERSVGHDGKEWRVGPVPLVFFHFSGFSVGDPEAISVHQNRHRLSNHPSLGPLFLEYRDRLLDAGFATFSRLRPGYDFFPNGVPIAEIMRTIWDENDGETRWPNPRDSEDPAGFHAWMASPVPDGGGNPTAITRLAMEIHGRRTDLQKAFPDPLGKDALSYLVWFLADGVHQHGIHPSLAGDTGRLGLKTVSVVGKQVRPFFPKALARRLRALLFR